MVPLAAGIAVLFTLVVGRARPCSLPALALLLMLPAAALQFPLATFYRQLDFRRLRKWPAVDPIIGFVVTVTLAISGPGYWSFVLGAIAGSWAGAVVALRACSVPARSPLRARNAAHRTSDSRLPLLIIGLSPYWRCSR